MDLASFSKCILSCLNALISAMRIEIFWLRYIDYLLLCFHQCVSRCRKVCFCVAAVQLHRLFSFAFRQAMAVMDLVDMSKFPDELCKKINGIIARCTSQGQKVSGAEEVLNLLKGADLLWEVQGAPEFTGVSRFNRKSYGVGAADSQFLGADILEQEWSWAKAANCVDIEVPPQPHCADSVEWMM